MAKAKVPEPMEVGGGFTQSPACPVQTQPPVCPEGLTRPPGCPEITKPPICLDGTPQTYMMICPITQACP